MKKGISLNEIIIVVIVVSILAGLAIPQYHRTVERMRCAEGKAALLTLRDAQLRYKADSDSDTYTTDVNDLDMEFSRNGKSIFKYFDTPVAQNVSGFLGKIVKKDGTYTLHIHENGIIFCSSAKKEACSCLGVEPMK